MWKHFCVLAIIVGFEWTCPVLNAQMPCASNLTEQYANIIYQIAQISIPDGRRTLPQYAREKGLKTTDVEKLFKGTGQMNCNGKVATANITGKANVLTFAGHQLYEENCGLKEPLKCIFTLDENPGTKEYEIDYSSLKKGDCRAGSITDWATVKLKEMVPNVKPYEIPTDEIPPRIQRNQPLLQASFKHDNFIVDGKYPKTIEECFAQDIDRRPTTPIQTSCNTGGASSGSAQFIREASTGKTVIGALNTREHARLKPGSGYDPDGLYNGSVELRGDFLKAVRENLK